MKPLTPTPEQDADIEKVAHEPTGAALVASDTGTGKTLLAVEVARRRGAKVVLVVAPPNTRKGWADTFTRQGFEHPFRVIDAKNLGNFERLRQGEPGVYFVSRQFFALSGTDQKPNPKKPIPPENLRKKRWSWGVTKPDITIYDEVHAVQNRYSAGFEALSQIKSGFRLAMSATPAGNSFIGIWAVCRWLWPDLVDKSKWRWAAQWCKMTSNQYTRYKVLGEKNPGAWVASLPCYVRAEAERIPYDTKKVIVQLSDTQRALYDRMKDEALVWLDEHPLAAEIPAVQYLRLRQITLGEPTFNDEGEVDFADDCRSSKLDALETILSWHEGEPVLVFTDSARFARVVAKRIPGAVAWTGDTDAKTRAMYMEQFGKPGGPRVLVATVAAIGEGTDGLQRVCSTEVWLSESLNGILNEQALGRLNRTGQSASIITQYKVVAEHTADDGTFDRLARERVQRRETLNV